MSEHEDKHTNDFHELSGKEGMQKISELVKGIHIAMMSTLAAGGQIHSRPMGTQDVPFNGTFWFLTRNDADKVNHIRQNQTVTLDYADSHNSKYITLRGKASSIRTGQRSKSS